MTTPSQDTPLVSSMGEDVLKEFRETMQLAQFHLKEHDKAMETAQKAMKSAQLHNTELGTLFTKMQGLWEMAHPSESTQEPAAEEKKDEEATDEFLSSSLPPRTPTLQAARRQQLTSILKTPKNQQGVDDDPSTSSLTPKPKRHLSFGENMTREISPRDGTPQKSPPKPDLLEYDAKVRDDWLDKEDEEFVQEFSTVVGLSKDHIKQILAVARNRGLLQRINPKVLDQANQKAWKSLGDHRKKFDAIVKQVDARLQKEYDNA